MGTRRPPLTLDALSLRKAERAFLAGGTETGKSTLADYLGLDFVRRYGVSSDGYRLPVKKRARRLLLDSKPRYRARWTVQGVSAARRYKSWDHGPLVPNSVVVDDLADLRSAWELSDCETVIVQGRGRREIPRLVAAADLFLEDCRASQPHLLQVDETMDFFYPNGSPIGGNDAILQFARAGRERGGAALYCSQRTKGIPAQLMEELTRLYAFRLDYKADAKRFQEMGAPPFPLPTEIHQFMYWYKRD